MTGLRDVEHIEYDAGKWKGKRGDGNEGGERFKTDMSNLMVSIGDERI